MKQALTILFLIAAISSSAQDKFSSIGLRFGGMSGVSFKYVDDDLLGFELIAGGKDGGFKLTGLIQSYRQVATNKVPGLFMFMGGGAHAGYSKYVETYSIYVDGRWYYSDYQRVSPVIGGDFILGAEYHFESIPLHLTIDYKPYFEIFGEQDFRLDLWDFGFTIKYAFNG